MRPFSFSFSLSYHFILFDVTLFSSKSEDDGENKGISQLSLTAIENQTVAFDDGVLS
jgi:hypothetical protein